MDLDRLKYLAGVEVMSWDVDGDVAPSICEGNGPLVVRKEGEIVRSFPWHCVPKLVPDPADRGRPRLYIRDMIAGRRVVAEYATGEFDQVAHEPRFRVIQLPRPPAPRPLPYRLRT